LLAGRNEAKLKTLAGRFGLKYVVFDVNEKEKLLAALQGKKVFEQNGFLSEGTQTIEAKVNVAPGVYAWRIRGAFGSVGGKWISE